MKTIAQIFWFFAFASLGLAAAPTRESQIDDIREAVFRWQFEHNDSEAKVYFLQVGAIEKIEEIEKSDPSDEFMKRFANHKPPVRKGSASKTNSRGSVIDKKTGKWGCVFMVTSIKWKSDAEIDVEGGYIVSSLGGSGGTYTLNKDKDKWKVTNYKLEWML